MSEPHSPIRIDRDRLWAGLMEMAKIGATPRGGCNRQAATPEDGRGRDLYVRWCREAGLEVSVDGIGNIFARRAGRNDTLAPVIAGSHLDTQPTGGKFDGVYGVLAGLEVMRSLNDHDLRTEAPLEVVVWTNEEGSRFAPAMVGSGVWAGVYDLDFAYARTDKDGITQGEALEQIGYRGETPARARPLRAAFEAHIEQGPILEREGKCIGIVSGVQGMNWFDVVIHGEACHAGPTPMEGRRDPFRAVATIVSQLYEMIAEEQPWGRVTFGDMRVEPGSRNTVPERVVLSVDMRHPEQSVLDRLEARLRKIVGEICTRHDLGSEVREEWRAAAVEFDPGCVLAVKQAAEMLGYRAREMFSGAGHDSVHIASVAPAGMIFVPCEGGLSHNELENAVPHDLAAGCNVLLHAMLQMADSVTT